MVAVQNVERAIFPLDEELGLQPGRYTPRLQEAMTRLGSKLPFQQAADEIEAFWRTEISEPTVRRTTHENGRACETVARQAVEAIEVQMPDPPGQAERLVISADGAFIGLTNGEWREVKTVVIGEFAAQWDAKKSDLEVKSSKLSYFSRSYPAREFERFALGELHRRGLEEAKEVVAVNDGAAWIQSFIDYHCPKAVRVIDFAHAQSYVALMGKAILGEETEAFKSWYRTKSHQLKHEPPNRLLSELAWFGQQAQTIEQEEAIERGLSYLSRRREMIDYRHFRTRGYPIGSGSVESSHKHVVHSRLKQAGMRWAEGHVDPLLSLRNLICNDRWAEGWQQLLAFRQEQRWIRRHIRQPRPVMPPINTDADCETRQPVNPLPSTVADTAPKKPWRPPADHPWRRPWLPSRS
jgi:hypothetical protein